MMTVKRINQLVQEELKKKGLEKVPAREASRWLDEAGLLRDDPGKPGEALRRLLRKDEIIGGEKKGGKWFIFLAFEKDISREIEQLSGYEYIYKDIIEFAALKELLRVHPEAFITRLRIIGEKIIKVLARESLPGFSDSRSFFETTRSLHEQALINGRARFYIDQVRILGNMSSHYEGEGSLNQDDALMAYSALIFFLEESADLVSRVDWES